MNSLIPNNNRFQYEDNKHFKHLGTSYQKKDTERSIIIKTAQLIASFFKDIWRKTDIYCLSKEHNRTIMIQENLLTHGDMRGANDNIQIKAFLKHLKSKNNPEFTDLRQALGKLPTLDDIRITSLFSGGRDSIASKYVAQCQKLKPGESMWVELSSRPGEHSMKGRIERDKDGKYILQMSNTGAGVDKRPEWHKREYLQSAEFYQTVIQWGPFENSDPFNQEFFIGILDATLDGKVPSGSKLDEIEGTGANNENLQAIDAVYKTLEHYLQGPSDLPRKTNPKHWSTLQEGPSCVPNSIWALFRVSLSVNEYNQLRTEIQLHNLKCLYESIVSGDDRTSYALMLALEQVNRLIIKEEANGTAAPQLLTNIQLDLGRRADDLKLKVKIANSSPRVIGNSTTEIELVIGRLERVKGALEANVFFEPIKNLSPVKLKIERSPSGEPTGLNTLAYVLYNAILKDNDKEVAKALEHFVTFLRGIDDPAQANVNKSELNYLVQMFYVLSNDLREIDGTLRSRPKQLALINISESLFTILYANYIKENAGAGAYQKENSAIILADLDVFNMIMQQKKDASTFSKIASKPQFEGREENIWYVNDRAIRPFHMKSKWMAYNERMYKDASIQNAMQEKLEAGENIILSSLIPPPMKIVWEKKSSQLMAGTHSPIYVSLLNRLDKDKPPTNEIVAKTNPQIDKSLQKLDFTQDKGSLSSTNLAGNAYLIYRLLHEKPLDITQLMEIMNKMEKLEIKTEEIDTNRSVPRFLMNYCVNLRRTGDRSAESLALQQLAIKLSVKISKINYEPISRELSKEVDYYDILDPKIYLQFNKGDPQYRRGMSMISLLNHPFLK